MRRAAELVLAAAVLMLSCESKPSGPRSSEVMPSKTGPTLTPVPAPGPEEAGLAKSNNAFALDLYAKLREQKGNLFLSPYSISSALAMTYAGARGQTAVQMAKALHFDLAPDRLHAAFSDLRTALDATGKQAGCDLVVANALWAQKGHPFLKSFLDLTQSRYGAKAAEVDFVNATEAARQTINRWVAEQTRGKIKDMIPQGGVDEATALVLTNAIYFKGIWDSKFRESSTREAAFTLLSGAQTSVPMMGQVGDFDYLQANGVQVLDLPYQGKTLSMIILLPAKTDGLPDLEKALTADKLASWTARLSRNEVSLFLPKIKFAVSFDLIPPLKLLGMIDAFGKADFSGMDGDLFVSAALHKAFVEVNEKGTEAAAATEVKMETKKEETGPVEFRADHPFLFLIRHNRSGAILFLGRVLNPKE